MKRTLFNLAKYVLAFGLLAWVVSSNWAPANGRGLGYLWQRHVVDGEPVHHASLMAAFLLLCTALAVTIFRWYLLVHALDLPLRLIDAYRIGLIGNFFSTFLPGSVGGDIVKAAALAREQSRRTAAVATVMMDRLLGLWSLTWFVALIGLGFWLSGGLEGPTSDQARLIVRSAVGIVAVSFTVWMLLGVLPDARSEIFAGRLEKLPGVGGAVAEIWRAVWMYRRRPRSVAIAVLLSFVNFTVLVSCFHCCAYAFWDGDPANALPSLTQHFLAVPIGLVIMAVPLFPGGAGIGELGFGALYSWFGYNRANGILGSLVMRMLTYTASVVSYLVAVSLGRAKSATDERSNGKDLREAA